MWLGDLFILQKGAVGKELFEVVKEKLELSEEGDYFSISYKEPKTQTRVGQDVIEVIV